MHSAEQDHTRPQQTVLLAQLEQALDRAAALQSLELQRLRLRIARRQPDEPVESQQVFGAAMVPMRGVDVVMGRRRAA